MNFLKATEVPQTKLRLKKAILAGDILVYESDMNNDLGYKLVNPNFILNSWNGFYFFPKCLGENLAYGCFGTSFYYQFVNK
jgi:hypothetical protein